MIAPAVELVRADNRTVTIEGFAPLPHVVVGGVLSKQIDLGDLLRQGRLPVEYDAKVLGRVEDSDLDDEEAWFRSQLALSDAYMKRVRQLLDERALAYRPRIGLAGVRAAKGIVSALPLDSLGLVHREVYYPSPADTVARCKAAGIPVPPALLDAARAADRVRLYEEDPLLALRSHS